MVHMKFPFGILYTPGSSNIAGWNMDPDWVDVFPIKHGDIPASYVIVYQRVGGGLKQFLYLYLGKWSSLSNIFFDWVETTNYQLLQKGCRP